MNVKVTLFMMATTATSYITMFAAMAWEDVVMMLLGFLVAIGGFLIKDLWDRVKVLEKEKQNKTECLCPKLEADMHEAVLQRATLASSMVPKEDFREFKQDMKDTLRRLEEKVESGFKEIRDRVGGKDES